MNLLSCDPARVSGFCIMLDGAIMESGEFNITSGTGAHRIVTILSRAKGLGCSMVIEDSGGRFPGVSHRVGCACGQWLQEARKLGVRFCWVKPRAWQMDVLGTKGNAKRDDIKPLSIAMAGTVQTAHEVKENEADSICLALHAHRLILGGFKPKWRK